MRPSPDRFRDENNPNETKAVEGTMTTTKQRRWMKTAIQTANDTQVVLPWARGLRRRPAAMKPAQTPSLARKA